MSLFQTGVFQLHSGQRSMFKIDADFLTDEDIKTIALMLVHRLPSFYAVEGVPQGGFRLAEAMEHYTVPFQPIRSEKLLIVDDVLTSGGSMEKHKREVIEGRNTSDNRIIGAVIFARSEFPCPDWITPLFRMEP